jgi:hypothetical protein
MNQSDSLLKKWSNFGHFSHMRLVTEFPLNQKSDETSCCWPLFIFHHSNYTSVDFHPFIFNLKFGNEFSLNLLFFLFFIKKTNDRLTLVFFFGLITFTQTITTTWIHVFPFLFYYSDPETQFQLFLFIFLHWNSKESRILSIIPFLFLNLKEKSIFISFMVISFFSISYDSCDFFFGLIPLLYVRSDNTGINVILFLLATFYISYQRDFFVVTIPILLSGF